MNVKQNGTQSWPAARGGDPRSGLALVAVVTLLSVLTIIGTLVFRLVRTDLYIANNNRQKVHAFYQAEAGAQQVLTHLAQGNVSLNNVDASVNITPPSGYTWLPVRRITAHGNDRYSFLVTGVVHKASAVVELAFASAPPGWDYAVFGDELVDIHNNSLVVGWDGVTSTPNAGNSVGSADIGSNKYLDLHDNIYIDGDLNLGKMGGSDAEYKLDNGVTITGAEGAEVGAVAIDPLGMISGDLRAKLNAARSSSDNGSAVPPITGNTMYLENGDTMFLPSGTYYLEELDIHDNCHVTVGGPVEIFVEGKFLIQNGSTFNAGGNPDDVKFYSTNKSPIEKSGDKIDFHDDVIVSASVYAPWAEFEIQNHTIVFGWVWGDKMKIHDWTTIAYPAVGASGGGDPVNVVSWGQLR